jgi:cytochrome c553
MRPTVKRTNPRISTAIQPWQMLDAIVWTAALMFLVVLGVHEAHAGEHRYATANPTYQAECGSCHIAYPPALLSAFDWTAVLDRLDRHYGVDASVDQATANKLRDFILVNSGRKSRAEPATSIDLPRISTLTWFLKEHRDVTGKAGPRSVRSMSDCAACHTSAAQGDFTESTLRIPR